MIYSYQAGSVRSYYRQRCKDYIKAIENDPRNLGAREYLAEALYNLGELDRAIDELQAAVDMGAGIECRHKLDLWIKERHRRDSSAPICRWCNTENRQGERRCARCGSDLPFDTSFSRWLAGGKAAGARPYLILIGGVGLIALSLVFLPLRFAFIPFLLCASALAGWSLIASARS